jgi:hypothetical protein
MGGVPVKKKGLGKQTQVPVGKKENEDRHE